MSQVAAIVDKLLTNVSNAIVSSGFIADQIFPYVPVVQQSGKLGKYGNGHLRIVNAVMGGMGGARRVQVVTRTSDSYYIEDHGLEGVVSPNDYRNVEQPFDAESDETTALTQLLQIAQEKSIADSLGDTATLTQNTTLSGSDQWNDYNNSDVLTVVRDGRQAVKDGCGMYPDTAIMSDEVAETLSYHPQILDNLGFKAERAGTLSYAEIAKALKVRKLLVASAVYNSAAEGQTDSLASIWGNHCIFAVLPDSAAKFQLSLGYKLGYAGKAPREVFKAPLHNPPGSTSVIVTDAYDYVLSRVGAAYLVKNAVA